MFSFSDASYISFHVIGSHIDIGIGSGICCRVIHVNILAK